MTEETDLRMTVGAGEDSREIAVRQRSGRGPALVWLGGFLSDMAGSKAETLAAHAGDTGQAMVRFDFSGHGISGGDFEKGTIGRWAEEALAVIDRFTSGPVLLVGSSMGGWISLLVAREMRRRGEAGRIAGMVLIAPAPDFTEKLMWPSFTDEMKETLEREGRLVRPSDYGDGMVITRGLIEDGRNHQILDGMLELSCPVHILQGVQDVDVPWRHAMRLVECIPHGEVVLTLVKDGDHRLSRPEDLERLIAAVDKMSADIRNG
ncbi:acetoin dehydrogenase E2 subunit dihydrolipoyllysine-residue acetyltransferase [Hartmannibacter diazotrophicus]|uniref:Acetoin dehydrogenase E2 subunit dihydrolipoyllysine-residue acetyltransferase n=1 Tax=Hartmannibacter diazotrophicus TaxID=1482074 RepID=A0A2C9D1V3_9HYPH|nr:alpha/beta hydrolase [Hartmannibacter diazotrophicus]SON54149.1 acetoin dehydrogenase E2 subunit dihydrolipoyllysine-residue acetyltransferase [Hartmannibacter diazotrophicus]